jgi:hypothetical protein
MTSSWSSLIPFLPFPAAASSEDSTHFSSEYCSLLLQLLNSQFQFSNLIFLAWVLSLMLRPTVSRLVCLRINHPSWAYDQMFITVRQMRICWCRALSLTRGRVCRLQLLLALASAIFFCLRYETSLFVASYDSQGYGGDIRPRLHTG